MSSRANTWKSLTNGIAAVACGTGDRYWRRSAKDTTPVAAIGQSYKSLFRRHSATKPWHLVLMLFLLSAMGADHANEGVATYREGLAWHAKLEFDKAIADYTKAIGIDPEFAAAYHSRGDAW